MAGRDGLRRETAAIARTEADPAQTRGALDVRPPAAGSAAPRPPAPLLTHG